MDSRINVLIAKMTNELAKLARLKKDHDEDFGSGITGVPSKLEKAAIGYNLHNFYNGCENVFRMISDYYENNLSAGRFHKDLLERMTLEIPKIRPRVITDELFECLSEFLAFRHRFRHMYSFEINWEREKIVLGKFELAYGMFVKETNLFLAMLEELIGD